MADRKKKKRVLVEHDFDWGRIEGVPLSEAADYLRVLATGLPVDACLDEHWTGYEDMTMRVISYRDETDEEYARRLAAEAEAEKWRLEEERADRERAARREEYLRLKREFG